MTIVVDQWPSATCATASDAHTQPARSAAWSTLPGGLVGGGEIVLFAIKPSMWRPLFDSAMWLIAAVMIAISASTMGARIPGLSMIVSIEIILGIGFGRLALAILQWVPRWYVLTNRRILDVEGVRAPRVWSVPLTEVRNTYLGATPPEKLTCLGTITIVTSDPGCRPRHWRSIPKADEVHSRIRRAIENALD